MLSKTMNRKTTEILMLNNVLRNPAFELVYEHIIENGEGRVGMNGSLMVDTGVFTGRSPKDKYFVEEDFSKKNVWWGPVNKKINIEVFNTLYDKIIDYYYNNENTYTYIFDGYAGSDPDYRLPVRIIAKKAWQYHFCRNMFIELSSDKELKNFNPKFTIINASDVINDEFQKHNMNSEVFIIFNIEKRIAIIGGTEYGGEMKKGIFSILHYLLPQQGVLSMHCSANVNTSFNDTALFFGLSGT